MRRLNLIIIAALALALLPVVSQAQTIQTIAGGGPKNLPALLTGIGQPLGIAFDGSGNYYFVGLENEVFRVNSSGVITTVAGNGFPGFSGDGGAATSAELNRPYGVAVDSSGNIYIADGANNRIRKVNTSGVISTVAGNGTSGFSGDGGPATSAELNSPLGLTVDGSGNIYIADQGNSRIRKVNTSGAITTVAGNGTNGFSGDGGPATSAGLGAPWSVALDASGDLYIADTGNARIREVNTSGVISTVAGNGTRGFSGDGGPATSAELWNPSGVAVDGSGSIYIADSTNYRIRKVNTSGVISTVAGNGTNGFSGDGGPATSVALSSPYGVAADGSGNVYIADTDTLRVRVVNTSGVITTAAGNGTYSLGGDGGPATSAELSQPFGLVVGGGGNLYIADAENNRIRMLNPSGVITTVAGGGTSGLGDGGAATSAELSSPLGVAMDGSGNLYIADTSNNRIRMVNPSGVITTVAGGGTSGLGDGGLATSAQLSQPFGLAVDGSGNLYIADTGTDRIRMVNTSGVITTVAGNGSYGYSGDGGAATSAELNEPYAVAVDVSGNLYISDYNNNVIRKVNTSSVISTVAGNGIGGYGGDGGPATSAELDEPYGVAVDGSGNLYIADIANSRIRKVNSSGVITTVAGNGIYGFSGDGGAATTAELAYPRGVALDSNGNLYVADTLNNRIREVTATVVGDFTGTVTPPTQTVVSGNSVSYTISLSPVGGFTGDVTLTSLTGLPPGASASFIPATVTGGSGTSTLTITTSATTPTGAYALTLTGTSGSLTHNLPIFFSVNQPAQDFTGNITPLGQTVASGVTATYNITVIPLNGFASTVYLALQGLPSGATATFTPPYVAGGSGTSVLTISNTAAVANGAYTMALSGTSGDLQHENLIRLGINASVLDFTGSINPTSQIVPVGGGSATYTINLVPLYGFTSNVALTASGGPAGTSFSLSPSTVIGGSGNSTLMVTTPAAASGTYQIDVTGTGGGVTHTGGFQLVVGAATPDFAGSVSPTAQAISLSAGGSAVYAVGITPLGSFSSNVTLSVSGLPTGATAAFSPSNTIVGGSGASTLTITPTGATLPGTYTILFTGTSGAITHSGTVTLVVNP